MFLISSCSIKMDDDAPERGMHACIYMYKVKASVSVVVLGLMILWLHGPSEAGWAHDV